MATPVTAVQVGSYFVGQYYQVIQQQPDFVHQFYTDLSTMLRVDGNRTESASAMLQIHSLIMSLHFTGIEIKTAHSLDSWNGGVIVMVSGLVQSKDFKGKRKFVQTFFLAPQEKGYFVLNDIFHFLDEELVHQHPEALLAQDNFESTANVSTSHPEPAVSDYMLGDEIQAIEFVSSAHVEENEPTDNYNIEEEQQQQVLGAENREEETPVVEEPTAFQGTMNPVREPPTAPVEEPVGEPPKQTYASILRVARGQSASSIAPQPSVNKSTQPTERLHTPQPTPQQSCTASSIVPEKSVAEVAEEVTMLEEGESRSVYVRNLPPTVSVSDIEQEFKNFGRIKPEGVVIRHRKDVGICYAFVEFEDAIGVQNAIQASPIQLSGRQVHIEERRANGPGGTVGGRRSSRGRGSYQRDAPRGRFGGRGFGRGSSQDGGERGDYNSKPRGNGFYQRGARQDRGILGNQVSRNGQNPSEVTF